MPSRYRFVIEGLILGLSVAMGLNWMAPAPLLPAIMAEYHVDRAPASLALALVPLVSGTFTIPMGAIAARLGLRWVYGLGMVLLAAGTLAPATSDFSQLLALRLLFSLGVAIVMPVTAAMIMSWFPPRELPFVNGLNMVGQTLGTTASLGITVLLAEAVGWRSAMSYYGMVTLALALGWLIFGRERGGPEPRQVPSLGELARVLRRRETILLGLGAAGPWCLYNALSSWLPTFYAQVFGFPLSVAAASVGLINLVGIPTGLIGGLLPTLVGRRKPFLLLSGATMGIASVGIFLVNESAVIYTGLVLYGVLSLIYMPSLFTIPMELPGITSSLVAMVLAAVNTIGGLASFLAAPVVGILADSTGSFLPGFLLWSVASLSLLLPAILLPETGPGARKKPA